MSNLAHMYRTIRNCTKVINVGVAMHNRLKTWGTPRLVLPYRISNLTVPKITANKLVAVASAPAEAPVWVLPFWQTPKTNDTDVQAAGVLRSADRGETWSVHMVP